MAECQVIGFDCPVENLCPRCNGSGEEPLTPSGSDPCCCCDDCFDEVLGWSTGIKPFSESWFKSREFVVKSQSVPADPSLEATEERH